MPAIVFAIDPQSSMRPFEQLRDQVISAVNSGELEQDARLPTVRALAAELGLATNTVARAYRELEREHVIETRGRYGSFIAAPNKAITETAQAAADAFVAHVEQLGVSAEEVVDLVADALNRRPTA